MYQCTHLVSSSLFNLADVAIDAIGLMDKILHQFGWLKFWPWFTRFIDINYITKYQMMQESQVSIHLPSTLRIQQAQKPAARHQWHSFDFSRSCTSRLAWRSLCCAESSHGSDATRWDAWLSYFDHGEGHFLVISVVRSGYQMHLEMPTSNPTVISCWLSLKFLNASNV